jgi:hypothetical protein
MSIFGNPFSKQTRSLFSERSSRIVNLIDKLENYILIAEKSCIELPMSGTWNMYGQNYFV